MEGGYSSIGQSLGRGGQSILLAKEEVTLDQDLGPARHFAVAARWRMRPGSAAARVLHVAENHLQRQDDLVKRPDQAWPLLQYWLSRIASCQEDSLALLLHLAPHQEFLRDVRWNRPEAAHRLRHSYAESRALAAIRHVGGLCLQLAAKSETAERVVGSPQSSRWSLHYHLDTQLAARADDFQAAPSASTAFGEAVAVATATEELDQDAAACPRTDSLAEKRRCFAPACLREQALRFPLQHSAPLCRQKASL